MTANLSTGPRNASPGRAEAWFGRPAGAFEQARRSGTQARVFVLHHYPAFRWGVVSVLAREPRLCCVGWADSLTEALHTAPAAEPDVVVADAPDDLQAAATAHSLHRALPRARLLLLGSEHRSPPPRMGLPAGVCHPLARAVSATELVDALVSAHAGTAPTLRSQGSPAAGTGSGLGADLTRRERKLLTLMARGLSNRDISQQLGIAMPTVKFHVTNILSKLQVGNRTSAVLVALRHQLVAAT